MTRADEIFGNRKGFDSARRWIRTTDRLPLSVEGALSPELFGLSPVMYWPWSRRLMQNSEVCSLPLRQPALMRFTILF